MNYQNELDEYFKNNINSLFNDINLYDVKKDIDFIVDSFSKKPWIKQKEIFKNIKIRNKDYLKLINKFVRKDQQLQTKITKNSAAKKYWNTILPFSYRAQDVIKNEFKFPLRIAIFPGVSCMFYCGFCGRNQGAKYDSSVIDDGITKINQMISETKPGTKISISGGLEPLTNPKLGNIIKKGSDLGFKLPLITNAYSLTDGYIKKNPEIWLLDSLRISLYGHDNDSYKSITQLDKSFKNVKKNIINFLNLRNQINKKLKVGFNYIILKENYKNLIDVIKLKLIQKLRTERV